jgi:DNA primase
VAIPDDDVEQVRAATDIVALIGEHTALKQQGRRWTGLCPFHTEKTPSFSVNAQEGLYYCFGCQASGDAFSFVRAVEHVGFADAVRMLADRFGVTIHEDREAGADRKKRNELLSAMEAAVAWYHDRLLSAADAGPARDYLRSRGYDGGIVRQFRLGWAPDDFDALSRALRLPERVLTGTGLGFVNRRGRAQDSFRARVLFPICDPSGHPVALGGRILPGRETPAGRGPEPKYKNSQETAIYSKRRTLYALNWAKKDVIASGEVVVCEGYTDVIGLFQAGVPRSVATCGTALAEEHFTLLRSFAKRIVLAYDADSAGQSATSRVYEWERRHEVDVAVADLPPGSDPGELARTDPEALVAAVAGARPFLQFRVDRVLGAADLSSVEGRAHAADEALVAVAEHPDDLVRDQYVMQVADRCRLDAGRLRERLEEIRRRPRSEPSDRARSRPRSRPSGDGPDRTAPTEPPEFGEPPPPDDDGDGSWTSVPRSGHGGRPGLEALRLAVHRRDAVADRLAPVLFTDELQRRSFAALMEARDLHDAIEHAPPDVAALLRRIAVEEPLDVAAPLGDPVDAVVAQLLREATRRALAELEAQARLSPGDLTALTVEAKEVRLALEDLDRPDARGESADRLVAWLSARQEGFA